MRCDIPPYYTFTIETIANITILAFATVRSINVTADGVNMARIFLTFFNIYMRKINIMN